MPERGWSAKRERQYRHIMESLLDRGRSKAKAEEIAARTVNKVRARAGAVARRPDDNLRNDARRIGIPGRSEMAKAGLLLGVDR
jgi:hypothetical protein